ncbi:hypothetical protein [Streptomyces lancefieldiae]|uniref:Transposase n=1 Tax=Streptomyces lancefieldiae TaxID=3075520 RepID=A0ABU3AFS4_9ACTN|nr:hypothetical protein [Streptomyces sp. DSM 40712]MDT0608793.1 hypothetical protein [Streptomyces sp. DSM 40712]
MIASRVGHDRRPYLYASTTSTYDETGDIDFIAVEHALNGRPVPLTEAEKIHAARLLDDRGLSPTAIGRHVGADLADVRRWKANGWQPGSRRAESQRTNAA